MGWFITFPAAADNSQSPAHVHTVALAHMRETALRDHPIWSEMQLDASIQELENQPLDINGREFWLDVQYVAD